MHGLNFGMGGIWMSLIWVVFAGVIYLLIRSLTYRTRSPEQNKSALSILKKRYAEGEISKAEFEQKKRDIA